MQRAPRWRLVLGSSSIASEQGACLVSIRSHTKSGDFLMATGGYLTFDTATVTADSRTIFDSKVVALSNLGVIARYRVATAAANGPISSPLPLRPPAPDVFNRSHYGEDLLLAPRRDSSRQRAKIFQEIRAHARR